MDTNVCELYCLHSNHYFWPFSMNSVDSSSLFHAGWSFRENAMRHDFIQSLTLSRISAVLIKTNLVLLEWCRGQNKSTSPFCGFHSAGHLKRLKWFSQERILFPIGFITKSELEWMIIVCSWVAFALIVHLQVALSSLTGGRRRSKDFIC